MTIYKYEKKKPQQKTKPNQTKTKQKHEVQKPKRLMLANNLKYK